MMVQSDDSIPYEALYRQFIEAIRLVAVSYEDQIDSLPRFVHIPDEIALVYDERYCLVPQFIDEGLLRKDDIGELVEINALFTRLSGSHNASWWTLSAMESDPEWERARVLARQALERLGEPLQKPTGC